MSPPSAALPISTPTAMPSTPQSHYSPGLHHMSMMSPGVNYCNSLFSGQSRRLLSVQDAAHKWHRSMRPHHTSVERTPLVTSSTACRVHISPPRLQLQSFQSPWPYLTDDCQLVANSGCHRLRSADVDTRILPRTNPWLRDRSFTIAGPRLWNTVPGCQRNSVSRTLDLSHFDSC